MLGDRQLFRYNVANLDTFYSQKYKLSVMLQPLAILLHQNSRESFKLWKREGGSFLEFRL